MEEGQQPSKDEKERNRGSMTKLTLTTALPGAPVREGRAEGQNSVRGPRPITSQNHLLTSGKENRRTMFKTATSQQASWAPYQPYVDLTQNTDSDTPWPMRTLQHLASDQQEEATQQERREAP